VTVGEDPAFGHEYFLRAEHLSAGLRWRGLLRGHFEFGTMSLNKPSLILVRNSEGRWNLERWLPPAKPNPAQSGRVYGPPSPVAPVNRLEKIEFDEGRINFKTGMISCLLRSRVFRGVVEQISPGRWQLQLEAQPWRSGVSLQSRERSKCLATWQELRRVQPAAVTLHWSEASLADASGSSVDRITVCAACSRLLPQRRAASPRAMVRETGHSCGTYRADAPLGSDERADNPA